MISNQGYAFAEAAGIYVSRLYAESLFHLRLHIDMLRRKLREIRDAEETVD